MQTRRKPSPSRLQPIETSTPSTSPTNAVRTSSTAGVARAESGWSEGGWELGAELSSGNRPPVNRDNAMSMRDGSEWEERHPEQVDPEITVDVEVGEDRIADDVRGHVE